MLRRDTDNSDIVYEKLPGDIAERHVLLMDPVLSTGHTTVKAIQVKTRTSDKNLTAAFYSKCFT